MLSADYIVGLIDGEGSFSVFLHGPHKVGKYSTKNYRAECHFYIKLREDELPLLKEVRVFFGCGQIYHQKDKRPNHRHCYRYEISNYDKLGKVIIPFFQKHQPHSTGRKKDFILFCQIFKIITTRQNKSLSGQEVKQIRELKEQMHK